MHQERTTFLSRENGNILDKISSILNLKSLFQLPLICGLLPFISAEMVPIYLLVEDVKLHVSGIHLLLKMIDIK